MRLRAPTQKPLKEATAGETTALEVTLYLVGFLSFMLAASLATAAWITAQPPENTIGGQVMLYLTGHPPDPTRIICAEGEDVPDYQKTLAEMSEGEIYQEPVFNDLLKHQLPRKFKNFPNFVSLVAVGDCLVYEWSGEGVVVKYVYRWDGRKWRFKKEY